jgi:hypothetical protein
VKRTTPKTPKTPKQPSTKRDEPRSLPLWLAVVAQAATERAETLKAQAQEGAAARCAN